MKLGRILWIALLVFIAIGRFMPMTLLLEPGDPEYLRYTSIWFIASAFLLYPSHLLAKTLGFMGQTNLSLILDLAWVLALSAVIYVVPFPMDRPKHEGT